MADAERDAPAGSVDPVAPPIPLVPGRLGILGGTFDPVHLGHLALAEEAREALGLERVVFVPAGDPWQKAAGSVSPAADRFAMVELAVAGEPAFVASRLEIDRPGPTYTVDTLETIASDEGAAGREPDVWFLLSIEALRGLPTWREPQRILRLARLAVAPRVVRGSRPDPAGGPDANVPPDRAWVARHLPGAEDRIVFLDGPRLDVSGTAIRARVRAGRSIRYLVPDAVAAYIGDHGLYTRQTRRIEGS